MSLNKKHKNDNKQNLKDQKDQIVEEKELTEGKESEGQDIQEEVEKSNTQEKVKEEVKEELKTDQKGQEEQEGKQEEKQEHKQEQEKSKEETNEEEENLNRLTKWIKENMLTEVFNKETQKDIISYVSEVYGKRLNLIIKDLEKKEEQLRKVKAELDNLIRGGEAQSDLFMLLISLGMSKGLKELVRTYRQLVLSFKHARLQYLSTMLTLERDSLNKALEEFKKETGKNGLEGLKKEDLEKIISQMKKKEREYFEKLLKLTEEKQWEIIEKTLGLKREDYIDIENFKIEDLINSVNRRKIYSSMLDKIKDREVMYY